MQPKTPTLHGAGTQISSGEMEGGWRVGRLSPPEVKVQSV